MEETLEAGFDAVVRGVLTRAARIRVTHPLARRERREVGDPVAGPKKRAPDSGADLAAVAPAAAPGTCR